MGNNEWKIILQAIIDQTQIQGEINKITKQIQSKSKLRFNVDSSGVDSTKQKMLELDKITFKNQVQTWNRVNSNAKQFHLKMNAIIAQVNSVDDRNGLINLRKQFQSLNAEASALGVKGFSAFDKFKNATAKFSGWLAPVYLVTKFFQEVRKGVSTIAKFDDAMTDVAYTSDITSVGLEKLGNKSIQMGKDLNTSAKNILEAVKIYSTANSTADDILRKAKPAIMLSNVSGMSGAESSKTINTALNQFELEDTEEGLLDIVDTLQYVSSQLNFDFTAGIKEVNEGIEASGNVAHIAGLNMQEYAAMVGLAVEKTGQSGSTIGNSYKTIFSRITKASSIEGTLDEDISKAEKSLGSIGVRVRDTANEFRDLSDIMHDIGSVWDSLTSVQKSNVGFEVAGVRQLNILNSLFGSWEDYKSIMSGIDDRSGMAMKNQETYADSLKGHLGDLAATGESIWTNLLNAEGLKGGVDTLNGLLTVINKLTSSLGLLGTVGLVGGGFLGAKNLGKCVLAYIFQNYCLLF